MQASNMNLMNLAGRQVLLIVNNNLRIQFRFCMNGLI